MYVTYTPEGAESREWEFVPGQVKVSQAEMIESRYNAGRRGDAATWDTYLVSLQKGDAKARRVLLWFLMAKEHPTLRYEDTPDFTMDELRVEHSLQELRELRDRIGKAPLSEEEREEALFAIDVQISQSMESEEARNSSPPEESEEEGKAPAQLPNAGRVTGS